MTSAVAITPAKDMQNAATTQFQQEVDELLKRIEKQLAEIRNCPNSYSNDITLEVPQKFAAHAQHIQKIYGAAGYKVYIMTKSQTLNLGVCMCGAKCENCTTLVMKLVW